MSKMIRLIKVLFFISFCFCLSFVFSQDSPPVKLRVIVDSATVKVSPEIDGETLARIPLNTILDAVEKQGEWYKVTFEKEGLQITGFVHEMLVKEMSEEEVAEEEESSIAGSVETQNGIIQDIESRMEQGRRLVRQQNDYDEALESLEPLIARAFRVEDHQRQSKIAAEIYLWLGMAYAGKGDNYAALREIRNMFEVNHAYGKEITRNIYDPKIVGLIDQAEKEFLGLITEYSLRVTTEPNQAEMEVNGKSVGLSPFLYSSKSPKVSLELKKEGYKPLTDEMFLTRANTDKHYVLDRLGRNLEVKSIPQGAKVFLDAQDTGKRTDCILPYVPYGVHKVNLSKENYAPWEGTIEVPEGVDPLSVFVLLTGKNYAPYAEWGGPGSSLFQRPAGITMDEDNSILVVDDSDEKVERLTPEGKIDPDWPPPKNDFRDLKNPSGIAVDSRGYIYVTDTKRNCVMKFDKDGKLIKKWGREGVEDTEFQNPLGVAVDEDFNVYVVDSNNHCIKKFSNLGMYDKTIGMRGTSDGEFLFPSAIAVNQNNEIFVADRTRLQIFSSEGEFISSWGGEGEIATGLNKPMGIAIDQDGYIYVSDSGNNRIKKFDGNGQLIAEWGETGDGEGQLNYPMGIAVDSQGTVFVAERENNRIQSFKVMSDSGRE
jgi:DNA-binding beta-propeller fold protein YncE